MCSSHNPQASLAVLWKPKRCTACSERQAEAETWLESPSIRRELKSMGLQLRWTVLSLLVVVSALVVGGVCGAGAAAGDGRASSPISELTADTWNALVSVPVAIVHVCARVARECAAHEQTLQAVVASGESGGVPWADTTVVFRLDLVRGGSQLLFEELGLVDARVGIADVVLLREGEYAGSLPGGAAEAEALATWLARALEPPVGVVASGRVAATLVRTPGLEFVFLALTDGSDDDNGALWNAVVHDDTRGGASMAFLHCASMMRFEASFLVVREAGEDDLEALGMGGRSLPLFLFYKNHEGHDHDVVEYGSEHTGGIVPDNGTSGVDGHQLRSFMEDHVHPLFGLVSIDNHAHYAALRMPFGQVFVDPSTLGEQLPLLSTLFLPLAKAFRHKIRFGYMDGIHLRAHAAQVGLPGLTAANLPRLAVEDTSSGRHYVFPSPLTLDFENELHEWVAGIVHRTLEPTIISEPVPPPRTNTIPPIKVVGATFETLVVHESRDVLVNLFAHADAFSRAFRPVWTAFVAAAKSAIPGLLAAEMDYYLNDVVGPGHGNRGVGALPALRVYPRGAKDTPVELTGFADHRVVAFEDLRLRLFAANVSSLATADWSALRSPHEAARGLAPSAVLPGLQIELAAARARADAPYLFTITDLVHDPDVAYAEHVHDEL